MLFAQLARRARRRFVDQAVRPLIVEPDHSVQLGLPIHAADLRRLFPRGTVEHRCDRKQPAWSGVPYPRRQTTKILVEKSAASPWQTIPRLPPCAAKPASRAISGIIGRCGIGVAREGTEVVSPPDPVLQHCLVAYIFANARNRKFKSHIVMLRTCFEPH